jgi:hypothetical protein
MIVLEFSDNEANRLKTALSRLLIDLESLSRLLIDLEREIAGTDLRDYRMDLERTEQVLR